MEGTELAGLFRSDTSGGSIILNASIFTCSVLLSVGSTGRGQGPTSTQNNLGLLLGPNLSLGLLDCHLLAHNPLGAENAAVPRLDVLSLRLHRVWIASYQLDSGERPAPCLLLHEPMERAHAVGIDETLLRLDAENEALEPACRVGTGRGFKDGTRSDDERRALASIDDFHRRTTFSQQQEFGAGAVGLYGTLAASEPVRRIAR